jgi:hypothetical protein
LLSVAGSTRRICNEPGSPVTVSFASRGMPRPSGVAFFVTPKPAMASV